MLAQVVTARYRDHLTLYRQARISQRAGIDSPESTLCDWIRQSDDLLRPIPRAVMTMIRESGYISTDDTKVTLLCPGRPRGSREARLWAYLGEQPGDVVFDFTEGRSGEGPKRVLAGYERYLQADACSAYDALFRDGKIIEVGCVAHARRKFFAAMDGALAELIRPRPASERLGDEDDRALTVGSCR
jgi:hypothetical protein